MALGIAWIIAQCIAATAHMKFDDPLLWPFVQHHRQCLHPCRLVPYPGHMCISIHHQGKEEPAVIVLLAVYSRGSAAMRPCCVVRGADCCSMQPRGCSTDDPLHSLQENMLLRGTED